MGLMHSLVEVRCRDRHRVYIAPMLLYQPGTDATYSPGIKHLTYSPAVLAVLALGSAVAALVDESNRHLTAAARDGRARPGDHSSRALALHEQSEIVLLLSLLLDRENGSSWEQIGNRLGRTRQSAYRRYNARVEDLRAQLRRPLPASGGQSAGSPAAGPLAGPVEHGVALDDWAVRHGLGALIGPLVPLPVTEQLARVTDALDTLLHHPDGPDRHTHAALLDRRADLLEQTATAQDGLANQELAAQARARARDLRGENTVAALLEAATRGADPDVLVQALGRASGSLPDSDASALLDALTRLGQATTLHRITGADADDQSTLMTCTGQQPEDLPAPTEERERTTPSDVHTLTALPTGREGTDDADPSPDVDPTPPYLDLPMINLLGGIPRGLPDGYSLRADPERPAEAIHLLDAGAAVVGSAELRGTSWRARHRRRTFPKRFARPLDAIRKVFAAEDTWEPLPPLDDEAYRLIAERAPNVRSRLLSPLHRIDWRRGPISRIEPASYRKALQKAFTDVARTAEGRIRGESLRVLLDAAREDLGPAKSGPADQLYQVLQEIRAFYIGPHDR
ncbi:hypothetical protein [Streptomyces niveus]|uniref:hypothetical protein n=1 Tax=Streptomyces niveus TaxID=193462 RepID=UPI00341C3093